MTDLPMCFSDRRAPSSPTGAWKSEIMVMWGSSSRERLLPPGKESEAGTIKRESAVG